MSLTFCLFISFMCVCHLSCLISVYNSTGLFKSVVGTILSPPALKADFYHIFSCSHIWKASKLKQTCPITIVSMRACSLHLREIWWWKKGKLSLLMRPEYKHDLLAVVSHPGLLFAKSCMSFGVLGWLQWQPRKTMNTKWQLHQKPTYWSSL